MGFYTEFVFTCNGITYYTCDRDGFEKFADQNIEKLVYDLFLYKNYIKNMLCFLNINRTDCYSIWPCWEIVDETNDSGDNIYFIELIDNNVIVNNNIFFREKYNTIPFKGDNFVRFLNTRFLCDKIWKKYNLPKEIINYIQTKYF